MSAAHEYARALVALLRARRAAGERWTQEDESGEVEALNDLYAQVDGRTEREVLEHVLAGPLENGHAGSLRQRLQARLHAALDLWLLKQPLDTLDAEERGITIRDDGRSLYLIRVYLLQWLREHREHFPAVSLHRFFRSDADRELHNHPWEWALSFVLTYGYVEVRADGAEGPVRTRFVAPFTLNLIRHDTFHRVELAREGWGAWTLFIAGPRRGSWGFMDAETRAYEDHLDREQRIAARRQNADCR